ncbi:MAG: hypothetical protein RLZZ71_1707 [Bacteroidota bacterium]|jgi:RimJ/RimL family protein N-acetyltransferase
MSRVYLRPLEFSDVNETYLEWFADDEVTAFLHVNGKSLTIESVQNYIEEGRSSGSYFMHAICLVENDKHIGNLKVGPIHPKYRIADLPCVIGDRNEWGKGLATEAIALGSQLAFDKYDIRKLTGDVHAGNIGSLKAYWKAGWVVEGVNRGRFFVNGENMDQVLISCFNPKYFPAEQTDYTVGKTMEYIQMRNEFLNSNQ